MDLREKIRVIEGFPKEGISFKDITTLLKDGEAYVEMSRILIEAAKKYDFDLVAAPEARGFVVGAPIAYELSKGIVLIRKSGKLPAPAISQKYGLEYGENEFFMHEDAIQPGQKVLVVDDLLATGGSAKAACQLVERLGGKVVACMFPIELTQLGGRETLSDYDVITVVGYDDIE